MLCDECGGPNEEEAKECRWCGKVHQVKQLSAPDPEPEPEKHEVLIPDQESNPRWIVWEKRNQLKDQIRSERLLGKHHGRSRMTGGKLLGILLLLFVAMGLLSEAVSDENVKDKIFGFMGAILILFIPFGVLCWASNNIVRAFGGGKSDNKD